MPEELTSAEPLRAGLDSPGGRSFGHALGLVSSVMLHGLALLLLILLSPFGMGGSHGAVELVPIEVETRPEQAPAKSQAAASQPNTAPQSVPSATAAAGATPSEARPPPDALDTKLHDLAQLRQSDTDRDSEQPSAMPPNQLASNDAAPGRLGPLKDFIRVQVERHWSLNLAALGNTDFSVPIRVEIDSSGTVRKAEIVDTARTTDPVYREVAVSARNAVLSASPLALPPGQYQGVMEIVLTLNPREALQ